MNAVPTNYPGIGDKIFSNLDHQTLLNCELVCKQWMKFFEENPYFWLKMSNKWGQSSEICEAWTRLIKSGRISKNIFANCLRKKFYEIVLTKQGDTSNSFRNLFLMWSLHHYTQPLTMDILKL